MDFIPSQSFCTSKIDPLPYSSHIMKTTLLVFLSLIVSSVCFGDKNSKSKYDALFDDKYSDLDKEPNDPYSDLDKFVPIPLDPNKDYDFGDSQKLEWESDDAKSSYQFKQYASIGFVCVVVVGVLFLCFKFRSSIAEFATPLKWFMLLGFNLLLFLFVQDGSSNNTFPALVITFVSTILSFGYLFGFKKKT